MRFFGRSTFVSAWLAGCYFDIRHRWAKLRAHKDTTFEDMPGISLPVNLGNVTKPIFSQSDKKVD